jgi:hypothetical protein
MTQGRSWHHDEYDRHDGEAGGRREQAGDVVYCREYRRRTVIMATSSVRAPANGVV